MKPLIIDNGIYCSLTARLGEEMEVAYWPAYADAFPTSREAAVGTGIKNVERIQEPITFMLKGKASHVIIPDLYLNDYDELARKLEIPTFSAGHATELELDRWALLEFLEANRLPVIHSIQIEGIEALGEFLVEPRNADKYIKVSRYRGDMETFHHIKWSSTVVWYDDLRDHLGPLGEWTTFIAQDAVEAEFEVGIDAYVRKGALLLPTVIGSETKDAAYFGIVVSDIPKLFRPFTDALSRYFTQHDYSNFFSAEFRITKDRTVYFTDATCRMPWPPGGVLARITNNLAGVILRGDNPKFGGVRYLCEQILSSDWIAERRHALEVSYPPPMKSNYAFHRFCVIDGNTWILPHDTGFTEFGSALGWGGSPAETTSMCHRAANAIEGYRVKFDNDALNKAVEDMKHLTEEVI